ncbi:hypothetical protein M3197_02285 [Sporosarcina aquimarina]|uniref:hypothetical protein n=1 Tax=Sporosarcina aquimarina TaxID=114975 RepID=UPI00203E20B1|nr:hypothetical protein [Sporosarcina aquimarina]MCM3756306.1 hypothetical protein [Sporosarcina aquimarina]
MKEFKITYFFDEEHYIRRFVHYESANEVIALLTSERDRYISFWDSREIYHELNTANVRVIQFSEYHRDNQSNPLLINR